MTPIRTPLSARAPVRPTGTLSPARAPVPRAARGRRLLTMTLGTGLLALPLAPPAGAQGTSQGAAAPAAAVGAAIPGSAATGPAVSLPAGAVIAARQAAYDLMQADLTAMKTAVTEKSDPKPWAGAAEAMQKWVTASPAMYPEGTQAGSHALPAVWSDHAGFVTAAANFSAAAKKLQQATEAGDKPAFAAAFAETGQACGACHRQFRAKS